VPSSQGLKNPSLPGTAVSQKGNGDLLARITDLEDSIRQHSIKIGEIQQSTLAGKQERLQKLTTAQSPTNTSEIKE